MLTREKLEHHITHLQEKHDALDKEVQVLHDLHESDLKIETLKKLKLHLKDEIEMYKRKISHL